MNVPAATALAVLASTALTVGLFFMKRQAERLPSLGGGWRPSAWWAFVRDPWWIAGVALQIVGYGMYFAALRAAPLSVVHTALNGGIALFVVLAVFGLGERVRRLEWLGVATVVAGLVVLGVSLSETAEPTLPPHGPYAFSLALLGVAAVALALDRAPGRAIGLSIACGLTLGLGAVFAKALANAASLSTALTSTDFLFTLMAHIVGFALMQGALQAGRGVVVVPIFSVLSDLVPIIGGILVYREQMLGAGMGAVLRPLAILLALSGAGLLGALGEARVTLPPLRTDVDIHLPQDRAR
jgi:drug/metabolite transporter (DMT)-like permease